MTSNLPPLCFSLPSAGAAGVFHQQASTITRRAPPAGVHQQQASTTNRRVPPAGVYHQTRFYAGTEPRPSCILDSTLELHLSPGPFWFCLFNVFLSPDHIFSFPFLCVVVSTTLLMSWSINSIFFQIKSVFHFLGVSNHHYYFSPPCLCILDYSPWKGTVGLRSSSLSQLER